MKVSSKMLNNMLKSINDYTGKNWELEYNTHSTLYRITEQINNSGGCVISEGMGAQKMYCFLRGIQATLYYIK